MANAQPSPNLRPMRPIQRVPFVEEALPLVGPPLKDPNDQAFATASAGVAPSAATPSFVTTPSAATPSFVPSAASAPSLTSTLASAAPAAAALASAPSAAGALGAVAPILGSVAPALGGAAPIVSEVASVAPAAEALISSPSAATALGAAAPALGAVAPNIAQYANPLIQNIAYQDPTLTNADRVAGIGQSHPAEDAAVRDMLKNNLPAQALKMGLNRFIIRPALVAAGVAAGAASVTAGAIAGAFIPSTPLNKGEAEAVRRMHEQDPAWQEMLRRQKEDPTYSPLHDDPQNPPPRSLDPVTDGIPSDPVD